MYPLVVYSWSPEREQLELCKETVPLAGGRLSWNKRMSQAEKSRPHGSTAAQEERERERESMRQSLPYSSAIQ